jgi:hypothetical protein
VDGVDYLLALSVILGKKRQKPALCTSLAGYTVQVKRGRDGM